MSISMLSMSAYITVYPIMMILPISRVMKWPILRGVTTSVLMISGLIWISYVITGDWEYLDKSYYRVFMIEDLTPNIGLFWYFFMEVFIHFRNFFIFAYQYHIFIYCIPLYIRLKDRPLLLYWIYLSMMVTFKSYPSYGDLGLELSIISLLYTDMRKTKYAFISGTVIVFVFSMAPILWYMWIYAGSGNANFYYAINLVFTFTQVLFVTDVASILVSDHLSLNKRIKLNTPTQQHKREDNEEHGTEQHQQVTDVKRSDLISSNE